MQASEKVAEVAGGTWDASLNLYGVGGNCLACTQQIDARVYVVGQDTFDVAQYDLAEWLGETDGQAEPAMLLCSSAEEAWALLRLLREDCLVWQCGACDAWLHTSNRPRVGVLRCSTCGGGGVDFRHADRAAGPSD